MTRHENKSNNGQVQDKKMKSIKNSQEMRRRETK
jgi:hypothetical protein